MALGKLSPLQERVLRQLADVEPPWTLTGGAALAGLITSIRERLERDGLDVAVLRTSPTFSQLEVRDDSGSVVVDLVADPTPIAEPPLATQISGTTILVDTPHQLLVNKLCALLSRSELRDLIDVRELLSRGGDLRRALEDCPKQDAGFSPLTFGWSMRGLRIDRLATALGWPRHEIEELERFRDELVELVVDGSKPPA